MGGDIIQDSSDIVRRELELINSQNAELKKANEFKATELNNAIGGLLQGASNQANISNFTSLFQSSVVSSVTANQTFLNYFYKSHGIIQTAIRVPVLDAIRGGIQIHSDEMDETNIQELQDFLEEEDILGCVVSAQCWARLFGGGAIIIDNGKDLKTELLDTEKVYVLKLYAADRWELNASQKLSDPTEVVTNDNPRAAASASSEYYIYYGKRIHRSRVITMTGLEAPSQIRWQLQGWGMSEVERMVEDFNLYTRTRNVLYDILNEAKIDVFRIKGFNGLMTTNTGQGQIKQRIATSQQAKNFNNALIMDQEDEYDQKQLSFGGIAEIMSENRMAIAAAVRMPISKIFGIGSSGFSSGEDDLENYNAMVESEVRNHIRKPIRRLVNLCMRHLWGDQFKFTYKFHPLRVMSAKDEEEIRDKKFARVTTGYDHGLIDSKEWGEMCQKETLITVDTKAAAGKLDEFPESPATMAATSMQEGQDSGDKDDAK